MAFKKGLTTHKSVSSSTWNTGVKRDWFILKELVTKDFKLKYRRSILGVAWSVLNPLLMMIVMAIVFTHMMRGGSSDKFPAILFPVYLIIGNVTFAFMNDSTSQGMTSIISAAPLLKKVKIERAVFPVEKAVFALVNFAFSCIAIVIVMIFFQVPPTLNFIFIPFSSFTSLFFASAFRFFSPRLPFSSETSFTFGASSLSLGPTSHPFFTIPRSFPIGFKISRSSIPCISSSNTSAQSFSIKQPPVLKRILFAWRAVWPRLGLATLFSRRTRESSSCLFRGVKRVRTLKEPGTKRAGTLREEVRNGTN